MQKEITLISAGMKEPKKSYTLKANENYYLNYSLLGLATILDNNNYSCRMLQGNFDSPQEILDKCNNIQSPLLISIGSLLSISWVQEFTKIAKEKFPNLTIICGGNYVIENNYEWIVQRLPEVDLFVEGYSEEAIIYIVKNYETIIKNGKIFRINNKKAKLFPNSYNYKLLEDFKNYSPSIEISRGCGKGCSFCYDRNIKITKYREPKETIDLIQKTCEQYEDNKLHLYLESAEFSPTIKYIKEFAEIYKSSKSEFKYKIQSRVDTLNKKIIKYLKESGCYQVDLGLESASHIQLLKMGKTKNPKSYLSNTYNLVRNLYAEDIWVKLNILLYMEETLETIKETREFLHSIKKYIKGVSISPIIIYNNTLTMKQRFDLRQLTEQDFSQIDYKGYGYVNLSKEINIEKSIQIAKELTEEFMTEEDYLDMKKLSTFKRRT